MALYLWIALGSALGGAARFAASDWIARHAGTAFPWGTILVNITGSFAIGFFAALTAADGRWLVGATARHFVMTGMLGGFTTYSAFSLQTLNLARQGDWLRAAANAGATFVLCFVAVWLGHLAATACNSARSV